MVVNTPAIAAAALYISATLYHLFQRINSRQSHRHTWLFAIGTLGLLCHGYAASTMLITPAGINFSLWPVSVLILFVVNLIVLLGNLGKPLHSLLVLLFPASALVIICSLVFGYTLVDSEHLSINIGIHVIFSLLAYSLFTIATVQALLLAYQNWRLKNHHPGGGFLKGLPPLQTMETLLFDFIWAGFILLSLSLISGFIFLENIWAQHLVHKTFFSIVAWLVYGVLLTGRVRMGWRGNTAIRLALGGFVLLALAYWGSKFVLEVLLN